MFSPSEINWPSFSGVSRRFTLHWNHNFTSDWEHLYGVLMSFNLCPLTLQLSLMSLCSFKWAIPLIHLKKGANQVATLTSRSSPRLASVLPAPASSRGCWLAPDIISQSLQHSPWDLQTHNRTVPLICCRVVGAALDAKSKSDSHRGCVLVCCFHLALPVLGYSVLFASSAVIVVLRFFTTLLFFFSFNGKMFPSRNNYRKGIRAQRTK